MIFLALKTEDGRITGKISFYCRMHAISRQGFYKYLANKDRPWKYQDLADAMKEIVSEDEYNDTYGRIRMYQALLLKQPEGVHIPSERTVYRVMDQIGLSHRFIFYYQYFQCHNPKFLCGFFCGQQRKRYRVLGTVIAYFNVIARQVNVLLADVIQSDLGGILRSRQFR